MKIPRSLFLFFLVFRLTAQVQIDCEASKMHAVYFAIRCCSLTFPKNDPEFTECHAKFSKMAGRPASKLQAPERIAINICAHECSLLKKGFIKEAYRNEFDKDAIEDYYHEKYITMPVYATYMEDAFAKCLKFDTVGEVNIKFPNVTFIKQECDPLAARIMVCVRTKAMQSCPNAAFDNESFDCGVSKKYFKECVGSIEKVVRTID